MLPVRLWLVLGLMLLVLLVILRSGVSPLVAVPYLLVGGVSFALYGWDKHQAGATNRRVPERTLHGFDLLFGIVGGLLGQQFFRHKTQKGGYRLVSFAIAGLHALLLLSVALALPVS